MHAQILKPVVALIAWTMVMWGWMLVVRMPALKAAGIRLGQLVGTKGSDADRALPAAAQWKAHNYNHLMEQPTLFYAVALTLALTGQGDGINTAIAWGYAGLRIVHSLVQATINRVDLRLALFMASSLCLVALVLHAAIAVF